MIQRRKPIARSAPPRRRRTKPRRVSVLRDRGYLDWIKTQQCVVTRKHGDPAEIADKSWLYWKLSIIDPAHGPPNGRGSKGPDDGAIPLNRWYHEIQTNMGWPAFEAKYKIDRAQEAAELYARYKAEVARH